MAKAQWREICGGLMRVRDDDRGDEDYWGEEGMVAEYYARGIGWTSWRAAAATSWTAAERLCIYRARIALGLAD